MNQDEIKTVLVGAKFVGKTALFNRIVYGEFCDTEATLGACFASTSVEIPNHGVCRMMLWDTAGQEKFHSLVSYYCRDAKVALVCYDISDRDSFHDLEYWLYKIKEECHENCVISILGNKSDLEIKGLCRVSINEAVELCNKNNATQFRVSAKYNEGINDAITKTLSRYIEIEHGSLRNNIPNNSNTNGVVLTGDGDEKKGSRCC